MTASTNESLVLTEHIGADGIIYITAEGAISNDHLEQYSAWAEAVKKLIIERSILGDNPILVLTDISKVTRFARKPIAVLRELLAHDAQFPLRSAIVGGNRFAVLVIDSIISILHRNNLRHFSDRESALRWLYAGRA